MSLYKIQEGTFELPYELFDCSANVFTLSREVAGDFSIVITREPSRPGEPSEECTERLIVAALAEAPGATVLRRFDAALRAGRGHGIELAVKLGNTPVVQRLIILPMKPTTLIFTASAKHAFTAQQDAWFDTVTSSLRC
jgi:hypothetical protein